MNTVRVNKKGADRTRQGHLWIYRSDVVDVDAVGGSVVTVKDERGNFVGQALFSDSSQIALRFLTQTHEEIDREWWRRRIRQAATRRNVSPGTNAYRVIYSEGDLLPSLIVDRYADVFVLQTLSQGTDAVKPLLIEILAEEFKPRAVIERNDVRVRALEGLPLIAGTVYGEAPGELEILQHGLRFRVEPLGGQKTGSFLDQRENRLAARTAALTTGKRRALDCFTFSGAFALHLAQACESVIGIDISGEAVASAQRNAELNGMTNVEFREANVFDVLRETETAGERFDVIVLDPPAFAKNRASLKAAIRGYKEINLRALKLLNPGGVLITCTCSYHVSEGLFLEILAQAAIDAHRRLQVMEKRMQATDHPVLLGMPETYYLKCVIARVI
ncbi:MAG TPA: class I SAM-dependent rRNA methyltransferase [Pyrinomonadaceae bacterium]|jgi:23S rRNA (cytosine1962-C5)-methyltransferase|nr:class I SAM-dependent rRNA methyltransferase [Pyrinomonadaceae bacterium]